MDFFDERVLATLKDSKPRNFTALLAKWVSAKTLHGIILSVWQLKALLS
jgi:hypothetical protein